MNAPINLTLASLTGTGSEDLNGNVFGIGQYGVETVLIQVAVGTSVTSIAYQGRISSSYSWHTIYTTATDGDTAEIAAMPEMRAVITNANGLCVAGLSIR